MIQRISAGRFVLDRSVPHRPRLVSAHGVTVTMRSACFTYGRTDGEWLPED